MADTVTTQTLFDGDHTAVLKFTNVSDGTGEAAVTKVDVSTLLNAPAKVRINRVWYSTHGMSVNILFDATADVLALSIPPDNSDCLDFRDFGGIQNNAGTGITGDIAFTTVGHTAGDAYTVIIEVVK